MIDDTHAFAIHISRGTCTRGDKLIADEFNKNHQNRVKVTIIVFYVEFKNQFFWMLLKPNTFRMSLPKVIMNANTFTMSILCVPLKPNTFRVSFPEMIMIANVFTSQKHQIPKKMKWKVLGFKPKLKIDVTRQAKFVGDSYIAASARSPRYMNYQCLSITIKHDFQSDAHRLAIHIISGHRNIFFV